MLLAESELNRRQLLEAVRDCKHGFHHTKHRLTQASTIASTASKLFGTFSSARNLFSRSHTNGKKSWLSMAIHGVTVGVSIWNALRSPPRRKEEVYRRGA
jgi:hypothetical protein